MTPFRIGAVFAATYQLWARQLTTLLPILLSIGLVLGIANGVLQLQGDEAFEGFREVVERASERGEQPDWERAVNRIDGDAAVRVGLVSAVIGLLVGGALRLALLAVLGQRARGDEADIAKALKLAFRLLPLFVAGYLLLALAGLVALLLLVVPAIMLAVLTAMYQAVLVHERAGPLAAIGRSVRLVWGSAWRFVGSVIVVYVPWMVAVALASGLLALLIGIVGALAGVGQETSTMAATLVTTVISTVVGAAFGACFQHVAYFELLRARRDRAAQSLPAGAFTGSVQDS